ncbi:MAG: phosphate regulon sensor histidine kinase PhoR [Burkholderiales bacterium]|nr:phosphate regulon sensor histidine kinase PhoR [Burkholderiales bacterium]
MDWPTARVLALLAALACGAAAGGLFGTVLDAGAAGALLGGAAAALALALRDGRRARRLLQWLRDPEAGTAPESGVWGDIAQLVQRLQRGHAQALQAEREQRARFLAAIDASPNGVLLLDAEDQIAWCNRVAADHLGLDPLRDLGQRVTHLVRAPGFVDWLQQRDAPALTLAAPDQRGTLFVQARGFGDGQRLVLSQDITERERADAMRRDFVANVSHEIRTPLTVLAGFVETMQTLSLTEAERRRVLQLMAQQTERMQLLVADLLTLARLEGSPRPPSDHWVPLAQLFERAAGDARTLSAGRHWIEVAAPPAVEVAGHEGELLSAIGNLLGNAVRYTPDEGRIDLRWIERADGGAVEVADTGIGIAREHLARLTERFYRVDASRARETGGTGLGLSIVKHVMQRHGGAIEIYSAPGKGSRFRLVFPRARLRGAGTLNAPRSPNAATLP